MSREQKIIWAVVAVVAAAVAVLMLLPKVGEALAPEPTAAWVAVEAEGSGVAEVGRVDLPADRGFRLHAVLEARGRGGETVYYTEAPALSIGDRQVPADALRRWRRPQPVKVLWFTVEGSVPFLEIKPGHALDRFRVESFFRPEWGFGWTVPGTLDPAHDDRLVAEDRLPRLPFGTQRYQVRIELYQRDLDRELVPQARFTSPGPAAVTGGGDPGAAPAMVVATLPPPAGPASAVFGLTEIAPPPGAGADLLAGLERLTRDRRAFGRLALLATILEGVGRSFADLTWKGIGLDGEEPWGDGGVATGDLLRVGDRVVVLYRDAGRAGVLDRADLCFDYVRGAAVRPLGDVFAESEGERGLVDWAGL
jgi:hypothetical protein